MEIPQLAVGHQNILVAIQIDIEKYRPPRPLGRLDIRVIGQLRKRVVAAVHLQRVPGDLRATVQQRVRFVLGHHLGDLNMLHLMVATQHIHHKKISIPVTIVIRKVNAHRESGGVTNRQFRDGAKTALAVIHPDSIRREQIVANIKVRRTVLVYVRKTGSQPPVHWGLGQALTVFVPEPFQIIGLCEVSAAIIDKEEIGLAIFKYIPTL